jgi:DNA-binding transcriptional LysR family regulator
MIEKLEYLLALAHEKHFGRAAETCSVSQPSLSLGLRQLEEMLGVTLVHRGSRYIGLTEEGERALEWARRIVADSRAMHQDLKALKHGLKGRLRIAVIPAALPLSASVTRPLQLRHPDIEFTIVSRAWPEISRLLDNLEIDAAISYVDLSPLSRVETIPLYRERYRLLIAKNAPFMPQGDVTWAKLCELPLCLLTPETQNRQMIQSLLRGAGAGEPRITLESNSLTVLVAHVRTGGWATVMPEKLLRAYGVDDEFLTMPITEPDVVHTIGLVTPARKTPGPLAAALAAEARRTAMVLMDDPTVR